MIVSLHLPKTAGSSFLFALQNVFGAGLRLDYGDMGKLQTYFAGKPAGDLAAPIDEEGVALAAMARQFRLRQTKGADTDKPRTRAPGPALYSTPDPDPVTRSDLPGLGIYSEPNLAAHSRA